MYGSNQIFEDLEIYCGPRTKLVKNILNRYHWNFLLTIFALTLVGKIQMAHNTWTRKKSAKKIVKMRISNFQKRNTFVCGEYIFLAESTFWGGNIIS